IGSDEALAAVKADVSAYFNKLDAARTTQKTSKSTTVKLSNALEDSRVAVCTGQFVDLGSLIQKYPNSPITIESFFDLATIRSSKQSEYTGTIAPEESKFIVKHTFEDDDEIMLSNTGDSKLRFYLAPRKDSDCGTVFIEMNKGEQTLLASSLGDLDNPYLKVFNADALLSGSFTIKIL
ncbi:MAG TPA: hypothetical protein VHO90_09895, partial [Bacteroidales bacterium]|nr:hypothetical protein [Bacteroidales bacterium]